MPATQLHENLSYFPAMVKQTEAWGIHVEYYILNPVTSTMERKRVRLSRLLKRYTLKRDKLLAAQKVADNLNAKLRGGWSPLHEATDARYYTRLPELQERFLSAT